ncbi:CHAT domain-containing protein [Streptomyces rubiginosohelvolus]|uniref:CHAT domain-containing protein n=1 Tax=Streptomyces rubiginosohelvolus TaxID=67362 RepID=UPI0035D85CF0
MPGSGPRGPRACRTARWWSRWPRRPDCPAPPGSRPSPRRPLSYGGCCLIPFSLCEPGLFTGPSAVAADLPTTTNVLENLPGCTISHFVCHGTSDPANPSRSRLILQDPDTPLTVSALAPVDIGNARLAYLSACSTAATAGTELLDESIHLTSAFQLAGFPHVIGNLWEASDGVAQRIAERFYAGITTRDGPDPGRSAASLHSAVQEIRSDNPDHPFLWAGYLHAGA